MRLIEIIDTLPAGGELVLTRENRPVATIRSVGSSECKKPRFGTLAGSILYMATDFDDIPDGFEEYLL